MSTPKVTLLICVFVFVGRVPAAVLCEDWSSWRPVDPAELAAKEPKVERNADAEALLWEVRVEDQWDGYHLNNILLHKIRIKVFNDRGREAHGKVDLTYPGKTRISDIAGRTVKSDGSIVELKKDGIFDRELVKASGIKVKAKSFVLPNVAAGDIIEYRWRETRSDSVANYMRLYFQREIPIQLVKYYIKPLSADWMPYQMRSWTFHGNNTPFQREANGFWSTTMSSMSAFHEEPYMVPEDQVRVWMLIYYTENQNLDADKFWKEHGRKVHKENKGKMKVDSDVQKQAAALVANAQLPEQKIEALFEFCRSQIKNIHDDASGFSSEQLEKMKPNKSPADTLKNRRGTGSDINLLFASMAAAAGSDARVAMLADRSDTFFDRSFADPYFLRAQNIVVRIGDKWRFYDPASRFVPLGMLRWHEEGVPALISDPKEPVFVITPLSGPEKSRRKRTANFSLSEDGTIEGDISEEQTGHFAAQYKEANDEESPGERERKLHDELKARYNSAEVTKIELGNATEPAKPFVTRYHLRIPGYAQRTGKRLFLQPNYFQRGIPARFPTSSRKHDIHFPYPWSEEDLITFQLPPGYALDSPEAPAVFTSGETSKYDVKINVSRDGRVLTYKRDFFFAGVLFPASVYPQLKKLFDVVYRSDNHTLTLKQGAVVEGQN